MKKETIQKRAKIANDVMNYIYKYIHSDINIDELAYNLNISKFHLHRIFKDEFNRNIYESIKSIRLQKASTLLISNQHSTISHISKLCGYSSQTSFLRAFKQRFNLTPKQWKNGGYKEYSNTILELSKINISLDKDFSHLNVKIVKMPQINAYYIRHKGYNKNIKNLWQKLQTFLYSNNITEYTQIALYHDNPIITPQEECQYVACVSTENIIKNSSLPILTIPQGVYAKFRLSGKYGDILKLIKWIYHSWLISNSYETTTNPSYAIYHKNHFLEENGEFSIDYYISIKYI